MRALPSRCAEVVEYRERLLQARSGTRALTAAALHPPQCKQGASSLERHAEAPVLMHRIDKGGESTLLVALCGMEQSSATRSNGDRPGSVELGTALLEPGDQGLGSVELAELHERLDLIRQEHTEHGIALAHRENQVGQRTERCIDGSRIPG